MTLNGAIQELQTNPNNGKDYNRGYSGARMDIRSLIKSELTDKIKTEIETNQKYAKTHTSNDFDSSSMNRIITENKIYKKVLSLIGESD